MTEGIFFAPIEVELRDGRRVRLREIRLDDRDEILQPFQRLSDESRYTRFMSPMKRLSAQMLDHVVHVQDDRELGLVAEVDAADGIDIVAGARYYVEPGGDRCEFAVTVVDGWQGTGLASRLMRELIEAARARGLRHMEGFVLARNHRMLNLARRLGFTASPFPDDATVVTVRLDLKDPSAGRAP